jgi:hypothetical protein
MYIKPDEDHLAAAFLAIGKEGLTHFMSSATRS